VLRAAGKISQPIGIEDFEPRKEIFAISNMEMLLIEIAGCFYKF
jgi:hypothetical protein